mgnify:CR=1 FL=1
MGSAGGDTVQSTNAAHSAAMTSTPTACHTGAESCFFNEVYVSPELKQFSWQGLYELIKGRKDSPKEGSYTTYLFEKGKEKILKKVGEECTTVEDVTRELEKRHVIDHKVKQERMQ